MDDRRGIAWLYRHLPALVEKGVLSDESARRLREHFGEPPAGSRIGALPVISVLGALLVGGGIVLILAHNWSDLGRPIRTALAFLPLLAAIAVSAHVRRRGAGPAACEGAAVFHCLAVAACLALVSQIYHSGGGGARFLLMWMILSAPLIWLLRSVAVGVIHVVGVTAWMTMESGDLANVAGFALVAAVAPFYLVELRRGRAGTNWIAVALVVTAPFLVSAVEHEGFQIALLHFGALASVHYLGGCLLRPHGGVFRTAGFLGLGATAIGLTHRSNWEEPWGGAHVPGALFYVLVGIALTMLAICVRRGVPFSRWAAILLPVAGIAVVLPGTTLAPILFNAYTLALGAITMVEGARRESIPALNSGMAIVAGLVVVRFFDSELSFVLRGIVFILLGAGFLVANGVLSRRFRQKARSSGIGSEGIAP